MNRLHIFISGKVQGVWFRDTTKKLAHEYNITGWVKNLTDGRVEIVAEGDNLERLVEFCEVGPSEAKVEKIEVKEEEFKDEFSDFRILDYSG